MFRQRASRLLLLLLAIGAAGCGGSSGTAPLAGPSTIDLTSPSFQDGGPIPVLHTCDGDGVSPPLIWSGAPASTETLALIGEDPDAPSGTFTHWLIYNIPATATELHERIPPEANLGEGIQQGTNDFRGPGYGPPCPPTGTHRYVFTLYALDARLSLKPGASRADLLDAIKGHVVAQGRLTGTYTRSRSRSSSEPVTGSSDTRSRRTAPGR